MLGTEAVAANGLPLASDGRGACRFIARCAASINLQTAVLVPFACDSLGILGRGACVGGGIILAAKIVTTWALTGGKVNEKLAGKSVVTSTLDAGDRAGTVIIRAVGDTVAGRVTGRVGRACVGEWLALQFACRIKNSIVILR